MYELKILSNGLKVAYEKIPHARSVSAGVWVLSGSRYEKIGGISHFIEHMLFKGTLTKNAKQIAEKADSSGGQINAYTTREYTSYYGYTVAEKLEDILELLSDMIKNSVFDENALELEKNVVLEEIAMYEDSPEDLVFDLLEEHAYKGNSLGLSITGTKKSVKSILREDILSHMESFYAPENMVLSVAGFFSETELLYLAEKYFGDIKNGNTIKINQEKPLFFCGEDTVNKDIEQAHIAIGYESYGYDSDNRYPLIVLNNALGGGMSSRLFQKIREERAIAYSVYSSVSSYRDTGIFSVYAGLNGDNIEATLDIIQKEIEDILRNGLKEDEIERSKNQISGSVILSGENVGSHMSAIGKGILLNGRVREEEETLLKINRVNKNEIIKCAEEIFEGQKFFKQIVKGK